MQRPRVLEHCAAGATSNLLAAAAAALAFVLSALPVPARAQSAPTLDTVQRQYDEGQFERAYELLAQIPVPQTRDALLRYLRVRGTIAFGLIDQMPEASQQARETFAELLRVEPTARLPEGSPPQLAAFLARVRSEGRFGHPAVRLRLLPSRAGETRTLRISLDGQIGRVRELLVWLRLRGSPYAPVAARCSGESCEVEVPEGQGGTDALEGYAVAHAGSGGAFEWLGGLGTADTPFTYVRSRPDPPSLVERPIFWVAVGGALAVGVVVTILVASEPDFECPEGRQCFDLP